MEIYFYKGGEQISVFRVVDALSYVASLDRGSERRKILRAHPHEIGSHKS